MIVCKFVIILVKVLIKIEFGCFWGISFIVLIVFIFDCFVLLLFSLGFLEILLLVLKCKFILLRVYILLSIVVGAWDIVVMERGRNFYFCGVYRS